MATTVGSLLIDLRADIASLRSDLGKANMLISAQSGQMQRSLSGLTGAFAAVGTAAKGLVAALSIGVLARFAKQALDTAGGLGELAEQLGVSTDALQIYQFAAAQAGISSEQLQTGMAKLTQRIGDAASGSKEAVDAFRTLGVRVLDAGGNARSTEAILADVADAIAAIEDPARRASIAVDLFGRSGQRFLPILSQGRDGLRAFERAARESGAVLSAEQSAAADRASDAIAALSLQWSRFAQTLVASAAPALTRVIELLNRITAPRSIDAQINAVSARIAELEAGIGLGAMDETGAAVPDSVRQANLEAARAQLRDLQAQQAEMLRRPSVVAPEAARGSRFASVRGGGGQERSALEERLQQLRQQQLESLARQRDLLEPITALQAKYNAEIAALDAALNEVNPELRITNEEYQRLADAAQGRLAAAIAEIKKPLEENNAAASAFGQIMTSAFEDAILAGKRFSEVLRGLAQDIARVILRQSVTKPLGDAFSSLVGGLFGGSEGGTFSFSKLFSPSTPPPLKAFAAGGRPPVGVPSLVGERGPELFIPDTAGTIVPNGGWGGMTYAPIFNIDARQSRLSASEMRAIVRAASDDAVARIPDMARRGGAFASAVRGR